MSGILLRAASTISFERHVGSRRCVCTGFLAVSSRFPSQLFLINFYRTPIKSVFQVLLGDSRSI